MENYLGGLGSFASHWGVVLIVGLVFLAIQAALSLRVYLRARRQDRILVRLRRSIDAGGDGRAVADETLDEFTWLDWVLSTFPRHAARPQGRFTRDDVLRELDMRLASDSSYLLLQRMGVMAPLLGVVLTVVGFYWLKVDDAAEQSLGSILLAVTPLVSGVGAGAVLALINQALLQVAGGRIERVRMSARDWFDAAIWRHAGHDAQAAGASAVAAFEGFARTLGDSAERHAASFVRIDESSAAMKRAARQFEDVVSSFHGEIKGIPQALNVLQEAMAASARALQELIPAGARAVANLDVSVAAFRTTIDREFTDAAKLQHRSSKSLAAAVQQIGDSSELLQSASDQMAKTLAALAGASGGLENAGARLSRTIEIDVAPSQHAMHEASSSFADSAVQLVAFVEQGVAPATRQLASLHETLAGVDETIDSIKQFSDSRADVDRLTAALARSAEIAEALASLPDQLRTILEEAAARQADGARARKTWLGGRPR